MRLTFTTILITLSTLALAKEGIHVEKPPKTGGVPPLKPRSLVPAAEAEAELTARGYPGKCPSVFGWCRNNGQCCLPTEWCCSFGCCPQGYGICGNDHLCYPT